jgi:hypothetical protein
MITLQQQKSLRGFKEGPLRMRLSFSGDKQPDHEKIESDWLTEEAAKKRKADLKDLRAWLELSVRSSQNSDWGSARPNSKQQKWARVFPSSVSRRKKNCPCTGVPSSMDSCCYRESFLH